jgi:hypothetical protein
MKGFKVSKVQKKADVIKVNRFGDNRDISGSKPTMVPRTRDGANFPGGRQRRKAMDRLHARIRDFEATQNGKRGSTAGYRKPGSMKR